MIRTRIRIAGAFARAGMALIGIAEWLYPLEVLMDEAREVAASRAKPGQTYTQRDPGMVQ